MATAIPTRMAVEIRMEREMERETPMPMPMGRGREREGETRSDSYTDFLDRYHGKRLASGSSLWLIGWRACRDIRRSPPFFY
jgi:hypothetical protein